MKYAAEFSRLVFVVTEFNPISFRSSDLDIAFNRAIINAINGAEGNAVDTFKETGRADKITGDSRTEEENEEFYRIAYGSISLTSEFEENAIVRFFFKENGYTY